MSFLLPKEGIHPGGMVIPLLEQNAFIIVGVAVLLCLAK
jgi:hypothetical protein